MLDVVAHGLLRGQVGTVVEVLDGACEVEFSDEEGKTSAELALAPDQLLVLHHRPQRAAQGSTARRVKTLLEAGSRLPFQSGPEKR